ncbi:MAG: hypothetical protein U0414_32330 [Polyangiaceae bacterium]
MIVGKAPAPEHREGKLADPLFGKLAAPDSVGEQPPLETVEDFQRDVVTWKAPPPGPSLDANQARAIADSSLLIAVNTLWGVPGLQWVPVAVDFRVLSTAGSHEDPAMMAIIPGASAGFEIEKGLTKIGLGAEVVDNTVATGLRGGAGAASPMEFIDKVVNSNTEHAAERAVERAGFATQKEAREALHAFGKKLEAGGTLPPEGIFDPAPADRVIVPGFGTNGAVVYQVTDKGVYKLKTVLEWRAAGGG